METLPIDIIINISGYLSDLTCDRSLKPAARCAGTLTLNIYYGYIDVRLKLICHFSICI